MPSGIMEVPGDRDGGGQAGETPFFLSTLSPGITIKLCLLLAASSH